MPIRPIVFSIVDGPNLATLQTAKGKSRTIDFEIKDDSNNVAQISVNPSTLDHYQDNEHMWVGEANISTFASPSTELFELFRAGERISFAYDESKPKNHPNKGNLFYNKVVP